MQRRSGAERKRARALGLRRRRWCHVVTAACLCTAEERRRSGTDQLQKTRWKVSATMTDTDADASHVHCNRQTQRKDIMPNETTNQSTRCPEQPGAQVQAEQRIPLEAFLELALPVWCRHNSTGVLQLYKILSVRLLTRSASLALHTNSAALPITGSRISPRPVPFTSGSCPSARRCPRSRQQIANWGTDAGTL